MGVVGLAFPVRVQLFSYVMRVLYVRRATVARACCDQQALLIQYESRCHKLVVYTWHPSEDFAISMLTETP